MHVSLQIKVDDRNKYPLLYRIQKYKDVNTRPIEIQQRVRILRLIIIQRFTMHSSS